MKKINKMKLFIIIAGIALICATSLGAYYAISTEQTNAVTNTFELGSITCEVDSDFDENIQTNTVITNTSEVGAFIRAHIIITWMSRDGTSVYSDAPVENADYTITINDSDWFMADDGYYYCNHIVASGASSPNLIDSALLLDGANAPDDFYLSIEVISTAIQANPRHAVTDAWEVVEWNGTRLVEKTT